MIYMRLRIHPIMITGIITRFIYPNEFFERDNYIIVNKSYVDELVWKTIKSLGAAYYILFSEARIIFAACTR